MAKKDKEKEKQEQTEEKDNQHVEREAQEEPEKTEAEILSEQLLRTLAEYDNYRKRTARERMELEGEVTARVAAEFLPSLDNLERALDSECGDENYKKGIQMIYDNFLAALQKLGIKQIPSDGEFNPSEHQAVQKTADDKFESGMVTATFQKGYKIGEKIIRFAMVAVNE